MQNGIVKQIQGSKALVELPNGSRKVFNIGSLKQAAMNPFINDQLAAIQQHIESAYAIFDDIEEFEQDSEIKMGEPEYSQIVKLEKAIGNSRAIINGLLTGKQASKEEGKAASKKQAAIPGADLHGAKGIIHDDNSGLTFVWYGGQGVNIYDDESGQEVDYFTMGGSATNATQKEFEDSVAQHIEEMSQE